MSLLVDIAIVSKKGARATWNYIPEQRNANTLDLACRLK